MPNSDNLSKQINDFNYLLDMVLKNQMQTFQVLSNALDKITESQENFAKVLNSSVEIKKKIDDFKYYEKKGSSTLPKNSKISMEDNN